jgi:hypothetical protein
MQLSGAPFALLFGFDTHEQFVSISFRLLGDDSCRYFVVIHLIQLNGTLHVGRGVHAPVSYSSSITTLGSITVPAAQILMVFQNQHVITCSRDELGSRLPCVC